MSEERSSAGVRAVRAIGGVSIAVVLAASAVACTSESGTPSTTGRQPDVTTEPTPVDTGHTADLPDRPNIVLITADDMRTSDLEATPYIRDQLAKGGVTFTDAISPYPLCCPARATILTGQYSHNHGVRSNTWPNGSYWAMRGLDNTLPVWLQQAGYQTGFVGKFLNGYSLEPPACAAPSCRYLDGRSADEIPPGWDRWDAMVDVVYAYEGATLLSRIGDGPAERTHSDVYHTTQLSERNDRMIDAFSSAEAPFFIWYSSIAPHVARVPGIDNFQPPIPEQQYAHDFDGVELPDDPLFTAAYDEDTSDKSGPMTDLPPLTAEQHADLRELHELRLESLRSLDDSVEELITSLRTTGELDNTVVIFTSDNGYALGEHRRDDKDLPYEPALLVPMIVQAPSLDLALRYEPGATGDGPVVSPLTVTTVDIPATIVSISGARPGRRLDGLDMTRPEDNPDHDGGDRAVLIESGNNSQVRSPRSRFVGVRTDRWTWFGWDALPIDVDGVRVNGYEQLQFNAEHRYQRARELYDREADPAQLDNVQDGANADTATALEQMTRERFDCAGSDCVWDASGG